MISVLIINITTNMIRNKITCVSISTIFIPKKIPHLNLILVNHPLYEAKQNQEIHQEIKIIKNVS